MNDLITEKSLIMEKDIIGGAPAVCILGERDSEGEKLCKELRAAILSPEHVHKFTAIGAEFKKGDSIYNVLSLSIDPVALLKDMIEGGSLQIESYSRDEFEGFSISRG